MLNQLPDASELRDLASSRRFDRVYYLAANRDVAEAGIDPLAHFLQCGAEEGRSPHPGFDPEYFLCIAAPASANDLHPLIRYLLEAPPPAPPRAPNQPLHVLLDTPVGAWLGENLGDVAMCAAAISRFAAAAPACRISVVASDARPLAFAGVPIQAIPSSARSLWLQNPDYPGGRLFADALRTADIVVTTGHGALFDRIAGESIGMLRVIDAARQCGARTALLGHGIGPLTDKQLRAVAAEVLPQIDLVCVREAARSPGELASLGVPEDRIVVTGDDATRICSPAPSGPASGLGLSIRLGFGLSWKPAIALAEIARQIAAREGLEVVPLPIDAGDVLTLTRLGFPCALPADPYEFLAVAGRCRAVLAGSYHAAVMSLSRGIPTILLSAGEFYGAKMSGLAAWFESGCRMVDLDEAIPLERVADALAWALARSPDDRRRLVASAQHQADLGNRAVQRLVNMVHVNA